MRYAASIALAASATALGCGAASEPARAIPVVTAPPSASAAPSAAPSSVASAAPRVIDLPEPPPPELPLPPLPRSFSPVALPKVGAILSVRGRSDGHAFLLSFDKVLIEHDGHRVVKKHARPCLPAKRDPEAAWETAFSEVRVTDREARIYGWVPGYRADARDVEATLHEDGKWECRDTFFWPPRLADSGPGVAWAVFCGGTTWSCSTQAPEGPAMPLPGVGADNVVTELGGLWVRSQSDAWLASAASEPRLYRYNGVSWTPRALPDGDTVIDLAADEAGGALLLVTRGGAREEASKPAAQGLLRFDGRAFSRLAVPPGFHAQRLVAASGRDVWILDTRRVYQWDGERLHAGEAPFAVADAWAAPGGAIWIVGPGEEKGVDVELATGVAARVEPAPGGSR